MATENAARATTNAATTVNTTATATAAATENKAATMNGATMNGATIYAGNGDCDGGGERCRSVFRTLREKHKIIYPILNTYK